MSPLESFPTYPFAREIFPTNNTILQDLLSVAMVTKQKETACRLLAGNWGGRGQAYYHGNKALLGAIPLSGCLRDIRFPVRAEGRRGQLVLPTKCSVFFLFIWCFHPLPPFWGLFLLALKSGTVVLVVAWRG